MVLAAVVNGWETGAVTLAALAEAAEGIHSAEETRKHGDQEIGLAVSNTNRIEPGQHDDAGDRAEA